MKLDKLKEEFIREDVGINEEYGKIFTYIDFGNVNYWFEKDKQNSRNQSLKENEKLIIDFRLLKLFINTFSNHVRFYYGHDSKRLNSLAFIKSVRATFGKSRVFTKPIQWVRHHLNDSEIITNTRETKTDKDGIYINLPKCNFDVEIAVDSIRQMDQYDSLCLFSGDADFASLMRYLKSKDKKIILVKGGNITHELKSLSNLIINAQNIKKYITNIKQKPGNKPGLADRNPVSTGR
ncbi:MAG: NYN domain-containing protein [Patescibacteria group bacterium]|nr:MAG: NYN domain-containing protein [Patescibacteria group bacterium]